MTEVTPILNDQDFGNSARILNLQAPATPAEPLRLADVNAIDGTLRTATFTAEAGKNYAVQAGGTAITITMPSAGPVGLIDHDGNWGLPAAAGAVTVTFPSGETLNGANTYDLLSRPGQPSSVVFNKRAGSTNWFVQSGGADGAGTIAAHRYVDMSVSGGSGPTVADSANIPFGVAVQSEHSQLVTYASNEFTIQRKGLWTIEWQYFFGLYSGLVQSEMKVAGSSRARSRIFVSSEYAASRVILNKYAIEVGQKVSFAPNLASGNIDFLTTSPGLNNYCRFIYEGAAP